MCFTLAFMTKSVLLLSSVSILYWANKEVSTVYNWTLNWEIYTTFFYTALTSYSPTFLIFNSFSHGLCLKGKPWFLCQPAGPHSLTISLGDKIIHVFNIYNKKFKKQNQLLKKLFKGKKNMKKKNPQKVAR